MLLVSLLLAANMAAANTTEVTLSAEAERNCRNSSVQRDRDVPAERKRQLLEMCLENARNQVRLQRQSADIRNIERENARCIDQQTTERRRFLFISWNGNRTPSAADLRACADRVAEGEARAATLTTGLEAQERTIATAQGTLEGESAAASADAEAQRRIHRVVDREFMNMRLSVVELLRQSDKGAAKLNSMAEAIDNSALGVYMRERMAGVLSSPAACTAVQACTAGAPAQIKGSDLNNVFNSRIGMKADEVPRATTPAPAPAPSPEALVPIVN